MRLPLSLSLVATLVAVGPAAIAQSTVDVEASRVAVRTEAARLTVAEARRGDILGYDVAISGEWALLGATAADPAGDDSGAAYLFRRDGDSWTEDAMLVPDDGQPGAFFGVSVALDGDRALVGGSRHDGQRGAAYVFARTEAGWVQEARLPAPDAAGDNVGVSVALQGDRAVVGASGHDGQRGAAYVFARTEAGWALDGTLAAPAGARGDRFGWSVALDGDRVAVGAYGRDGGRGAAYVFDRLGGGWGLAASLTAADGEPGDNLGVSVALDGDALVAGAPFDDERGDDSGAAYLFSFDGAGWTPAAKLTAPGGAPDDYFGWSVAVRGPRVLVGSQLDDGGVVNGGAAFLFDRTASGWAVEAKLLGETTVSASAGLSVALSETHALIGAPYHDGSRGLAHAFPLAQSVAEEGAPDEVGMTLRVAPNPVASRARVSFGLPEAGACRVSAYDLLGREVAVLSDAPRPAGAHTVDFDATALPAGVYVVRVATPTRARATRVTVVG